MDSDIFIIDFHMAMFISNNSYESYDEFDCFSIGTSYENYLIFNLGLSIKPFDSHLALSWKVVNQLKQGELHSIWVP